MGCFLLIIMKMFWKVVLRLLGVLLLLVLAMAVTFGFFWRQFHPAVDRTDGVVYGQRHGQDLTMDIIRPVKGANGYGVALMVSGGWKSGKPGDSPTWLMAPLLIRGYTIFAICHISQPDSTVMEIIDDMHRGIRFVRHHADEYGVDPDRIGVTGGSAGGHLSLMLATTGGPGDPDAEDPIDRESSAVQAVAIFYPVTDLLNLGASTENPGDGGPPKSFVKAFGPDSTNMELWKTIGRESSPIHHVHKNMPPTLIYHGDADTLTPLEQSEWYVEKAREQGCEIELEVHPGGQHGWYTMMFDIHHFGEWFDHFLKSETGNKK